jgi:hypothetical protein
MVVTDPIGPYSRPHRLAKIDGRTKIAKLMRETRAALIAHVGGEKRTAIPARRNHTLNGFSGWRVVVVGA